MATSAQPGPEVKRLDSFVGDWNVEGTISPGRWGAGGKFGWKEVTKWMAGRFFLIGHWDFTMPAELGGDGEEVFVMGYDANRGVYTFDAFSSQGLHQVSTGRIVGDSWIWDSEANYGGQKLQQKMTMKILSATRYDLKLEVSADGTAWNTFMEGRAVKNG